MSTKIEVNAMGDACPLPVVKTLKAHGLYDKCHTC